MWDQLIESISLAKMVESAYSEGKESFALKQHKGMISKRVYIFTLIHDEMRFYCFWKRRMMSGHLLI